MKNLKIQAVKSFLMQYEAYDENEIQADNITVSAYDESMFEFENFELLVLTDNEADDKAKEYIKESVWAFKPEFIINHSSALDHDKASKMIVKAISEQYENGNEAMLKLIDDFEDFAQDAIDSDGRGHFMSSYDGEEYEVKINDTWLYVYILNK